MTPFDWREFLDFADWLQEHPGDEAKLPIEDAALRTVISRAYYAAFHVVKAFVDRMVQQGVLQWPRTRRSIHDQVWEALRAHPNTTIAALADQGTLLKRQRTEADYSIAPNKRRAQIARETRLHARAIIAGLDALVSTST